MRLVCVPNGPTAFQYLQRRGRYARAPRPDIILLDMHLPLMDGRNVLMSLTHHPEWRKIPVIVFSSLEQSGESARMIDSGAVAYFTKPSIWDDYLRIAQAIASSGSKDSVMCPRKARARTEPTAGTWRPSVTVSSDQVALPSFVNRVLDQDLGRLNRLVKRQRTHVYEDLPRLLRKLAGFGARPVRYRRDAQPLP
jgi:CheY-like chemotaxis protein